jgi:predicted AlkP superfamily pyrophosphatase or phosphodiesterase
VRLLLITLDAAFQPDATTLLRLPHLGALADQGVFCDNVRTIYPSITYPAHTSLLTGCYPDRHGIGHNEKFNPRLPAPRRPWYWDAAEIQVDTLHQAARRAGREVASLLWPVSGHNRDIRYNLPEVHALPGENQVLKILTYGSIGWLLKSELKYGRTRESYRQPHLDAFTTLLAEQLILKQYAPNRTDGRAGMQQNPRDHMPDVITLHLVDLDATRHQHGVSDEQVQLALVRLDQCVGRLLRALDTVDARSSTIVAVASDHGQVDVTGVLALDDWLQEQNLPARAQTLGLGAYIRCTREAVPEVYEALKNNQAMLHLKHVYTRPELRAMHAPQDVLLAVEAQEGVEIIDHAEDEPHRATHGFGPDHPAGACLLWLSGPPFLQGARLRGANLVDVAPTLAHALHLELPQAQGRVLREAFTSL